MPDGTTSVIGPTASHGVHLEWSCPDFVDT